jgi:tRNA A58 N-methylase Trm61
MRRVEKSLVNRGVIGTLRYCLDAMGNRIRGTSSTARQARAECEAMNAEFDRQFHTDTGGRFTVSDMDIPGRNWVYATGYGPVNATDFIRILEERHLRYEDFTFVDCGSGKGRAVLLAATFPFQKVIGVEFSAELHAIAESNIRQCPAETKKCGQIDLVLMDVTDYELPESPLVIFLFNPFEGPIMAGLVEKVKKSFASHPRPLVVIYFTPKHADLWDDVEFLTKVGSDPAVYQSKSA